MSRLQRDIIVASMLIIIGVVARLLPHMDNFVPVTALALLAAAYLPLRLALGVPLTVMVASDLVIGLHPLIAFTWGSYMLIALLGNRLYRATGQRWSLVALGPVGAVVFFVVTNFGVWLEGRMYTHSLAGLIRCYEMALPFFRATIMADVIYTPLLFTAVWLIVRAVRRSIRLPAQLAIS